MAGAATNSIRSAYVAESTSGTIPATPGFTTFHSIANLKATPLVTESTSQVSGGARMGYGLNGISVSGTQEGALIYGVYDDMFATLLQSAWSSDVLKDAKAQTTVAVENTVPAGAGGTNTMLRFRGVEATSGAISLKAREDAKFSFQLMGLGSDDGTTTAISGATYTDPTEADPLSSGADVGAITFGSYTMDCMEALDIAFDFTGREEQGKISSNDLCGISRGAFKPVLSANMYVEANFLAIYNAARARHAAFAVTVPIGSVSGEKYTLSFPVCHFGEVAVDTSQTDTFQQVKILPEYDTSSDAVITMTRAVA